MRFQVLKDLAAIARTAASYVERSMRIRKPSEHCVFIGHGRSVVWKDLRDSLERRLNLQVEEFNSEQAAGKTITERIDEMLERYTLAFLVMTGEDEHADATFHARENVAREGPRSAVARFQACHRPSRRRMHALLEPPTDRLHCLPKSKIRAAFEDIRDVLEREHVITPWTAGLRGGSSRCSCGVPVARAQRLLTFSRAMPTAVTRRGARADEQRSHDFGFLSAHSSPSPNAGGPFRSMPRWLVHVMDQGQSVLFRDAASGTAS